MTGDTLKMLAGLGLLALRVRSVSRVLEDSTQVDSPELELAPEPSTSDEAEVQRALGVRYVWGGGREAGSWPLGSATSASKGVRGYDCSGFVDAALRALGARLPWAQGAASVSVFASSLTLVGGPPEPWAIAVYGTPGKPTHAMLVGPDGERVYGASGGGSSTHGQDPSALVTSYESWAYRGDYLGWLDPWGG